MNQEVQNKIDQLTSEKTKFSTNEIVNKSWNLFGKIALYAIVAVVVYFALSYLFSTLLTLVLPVDQTELMYMLESGSFDFDELSEISMTMMNESNYRLTIIINFLLTVLITPIIYGVVYLAYKADHNQNVEFGDIFYAYKNGLFPKTFLLSMVSTILMYISAVFCFVPFFILSTLMMLSVPFVLFSNASTMKAIGASFKVVGKNFGGFFMMLIVMILILLLGLLMCCVGFLAAYPLIYVIMYVLYKEIIGFESQDKVEIESSTTNNPYI